MRKIISGLKRIFFYFSMIGLIWVALKVIRSGIAIYTGADNEVSFLIQETAQWSVIAGFWFVLFVIMKTLEFLTSKFGDRKRLVAKSQAVTSLTAENPAINIENQHKETDSVGKSTEKLRSKFPLRKVALYGIGLAIVGVVITVFIEEFDWVAFRARFGHADAQYQLGQRYDYRDDDYQMSMKWYQRSAEQGNTEAMREIADMYKEGKGFPRNRSQQITWLQRAAELNDAVAMWKLAAMYIDSGGENMPLDSATVGGYLDTSMLSGCPGPARQWAEIYEGRRDYQSALAHILVAKALGGRSYRFGYDQHIELDELYQGNLTPDEVAEAEQQAMDIYNGIDVGIKYSSSCSYYIRD